MNKRHIIPSIIILALGIWFIFMPEVDNSNPELSPTELLSAMNESSRFYSSDEIADLLIQNDPGILLIDVRSEEEFKKFTLPGAINIPLEQLLNNEWEAYIDQDSRNNIFFGNDELNAESAWILCTRKGYKNNYVLSGGINNWFETIINPEMPKESNSEEALHLYQQRLAASQFFTGGTAISAPKKANKKPGPKRAKKKRAEGGC